MEFEFKEKFKRLKIGECAHDKENNIIEISLSEDNFGFTKGRYVKLKDNLLADPLECLLLIRDIKKQKWCNKEIFYNFCNCLFSVLNEQAKKIIIDNAKFKTKH